MRKVRARFYQACSIRRHRSSARAAGNAAPASVAALGAVRVLRFVADPVLEVEQEAEHHRCDYERHFPAGAQSFAERGPKLVRAAYRERGCSQRLGTRQEPLVEPSRDSARLGLCWRGGREW